MPVTPDYRLLSIGHYVSDRGGARGPATVGPDHLLFELITAGLVFDPGLEQLCGPGWIFAHGPGERTIYRSPPEAHYECLTLHFDRPVGRGQEWPRRFSWNDEDRAVQFAEEMLEAFHRRGADTAILGDLVWSQLRFRLDQHRRSEQSRQLSPPLAKLVAYLASHATEPIDLADMARIAGLSVSHLHASFREQLGTSPHRHLMQLRMRLARHRLVATLSPVGEIAREVGFANPESFCRAFRRQFGTTAAAYRRRYTLYKG